MSIKEKRRELFENEYVQYRQYLKRNEDGSYNEEWVDARWQGFHAALDLVVIELPIGFTHHNGDDYTAYVMDADKVVEAIESTGLGIKIK